MSAQTLLAHALLALLVPTKGFLVTVHNVFVAHTDRPVIHPEPGRTH